MRALVILCCLAAPALADTMGTPVRNRCVALDGSGDLCAMAAELAARLTAEGSRTLLPGVQLLGATQGGAEMTLQVLVAQDIDRPTAEAIACADPRVAGLIAKGLWVAMGGLSTDPVTVSTCEGP